MIIVSTKDGLIITGTTTGIFIAMKTAKIKSQNFLDAMDIMKLAEGIREGALLKDYAVYKKSINEWMIPLLHSMNNNTKILQLLVAKKMQLTGLLYNG